MLIDSEAATEPQATATPLESAPVDNLLQRMSESLSDERKELLLEFVRGHVIDVLRLDAGHQDGAGHQPRTHKPTLPESRSHSLKLRR